MTNLNPNFNGGIDIANDILAYIDESGDDGFKFDKGCTKWFAVSALVTNYAEIQRMNNTLVTFKNKYKSQTTTYSRLSFKNLSHNSRRDVLAMLSNHKYLSVHSVFYKPEIEPNDRICTYPSMYFVGVKNCIERLSWLAKKHNKKRVHILISSRATIKNDELSKYLFSYSVLAQKNLTYHEKIGQVSLNTEDNCPRLLFGDYCASAMRFCLEKTGEANMPESIYAEIFLKGKLFTSCHQQYKGVWNNGLKCTPNDQRYMEYAGILEEGTHEI